MSTAQYKCQKNGWQPRSPGSEVALLCFGRAVENGGTFHTFCEEELHELVPKNIARTPRKHLDRRLLLFEDYLPDLTALFILRNGQMKTGT